MKNKSPFFSTRLKELRGSLSQKEMADKIGIPQQTYAGWELGNRQPKLDKLAEIALQFAVSSDWLLGLSDGPSPGVALTATGSSVAANHSTVSTGGLDAEERSRLLGIIESQQSVIASLAGKGK